MIEEVVSIQDAFYILSTSARIDDRTRVLKQGDTFAIFDRFGDVEALGSSELGLYYQDTRFLSRLVLRLAKHRPLLLSSTIKDDNAILGVDLMNPDVSHDDGVTIPHGTLHVFRAKLLWQGACHERIRIHNYGLTPVNFSLGFEFGADFRDIFEVRGAKREARGRMLPAQLKPDGLVLAYEGLDGRVRRTRIVFDTAPARIGESAAHYELSLKPRGEAIIRMAVSCEIEAAREKRVVTELPRAAAQKPTHWYEEAAAQSADALTRARADDPAIFTSNEQFNDWLNRSIADLHMMRTETAHGPYPYAGVPWFSTAFGRDGIITALQCLWFNPAIARGVLQFLAAMQADHESPVQDAQPGKILHEVRAGEMAALGEVPFGCYYGSVDSTPLFVMLAGAYHERTGDRAFAESLWPHIERALAWIDQHGDRDGDGFVEYERRTESGLAHQGWKDSHDAIFHEDGGFAEPPITLCEVQGYVFAARLAAAELARELGKDARAEALRAQAAALRQKFEAAFWDEQLGSYVLALDGRKRPCRIRTSNAGHCLFAGIAEPEHARRVAATLESEASFSGWGLRTVADTEARYSPMSYHNGSIWPHDNALVAAGLSRYGFKHEAVKIMAGLFDASLFFDLHRLPELFCGFPRRPGESPTLYPVSCAPQAWASGAVLLLLQSCLGLEMRAAERRLIFTRPLLPEFLQEIRISNLRLNDACVDLVLSRHGGDVGVNVLRREGEIAVVVVK